MLYDPSYHVLEVRIDANFAVQRPASRVCVSQCRFWQSQYSTSFSLRKFVQKWLSNSICIEWNLYSTRTQGQVCQVDHSIMMNYIECCRVSSIKSKTPNFRVHAVSTALNRFKLTDPSIVDPPDSRKPISPPHLRKLGGLRGVRIPSTVDLSQVLLIHYTSEVGSGTNRPWRGYGGYGYDWYGYTWARPTVKPSTCHNHS